MIDWLIEWSIDRQIDWKMSKVEMYVNNRIRKEAVTIIGWVEECALNSQQMKDVNIERNPSLSLFPFISPSMNIIHSLYLSIYFPIHLSNNLSVFQYNSLPISLPLRHLLPRIPFSGIYRIEHQILPFKPIPKYWVASFGRHSS